MKWIKAEDKPRELLRRYYCITYSAYFKQEFKKMVLITLDGNWQCEEDRVLFWLDETPSPTLAELQEENDKLKKEVAFWKMCHSTLKEALQSALSNNL